MNKNQKLSKVILSAGGTGGHLFPAIAIGELLTETQKILPILITDKRCKKYLPDNFAMAYQIIDLHLKFKNIVAKINGFFQILRAFFLSLIFLYKEKPKLVIGFGGYPSLPTLLSAAILRIPIVIHEQNAYMGRVNMLFSGIALHIITPRKNILNINNNLKKKLIVTGRVIRKSLKNSVGEYNSQKIPFHLFVVGGSQGAEFFDKLIPATIEILLKTTPDLKIKITQQISRNSQPTVKNTYDQMRVESELSNFFSNIEEIYSSAQLVICRSGASTIDEITHNNLPAIFIPYPHAKDDHQFFNAKEIADNSCGWCYRQEEISPQILAKHIKKLITSPKILDNVSLNIKNNNQVTDIRHLTDTILNIIS